MSLTQNFKEYIARHAGILSGADHCFSDTTATTIEFWAATDAQQFGSTMDAITTIFMFGGYTYEDRVAKTGLINNAKLTAENGGTALVSDDIIWISNNSNAPDKFCFTPGTPTPTPAPVPDSYNITFESVPSAARIKIDGAKTYRLTPETFALSTGQHEVILSREGYADLENLIDATSEITYTWSLIALPPETPVPIEIEVVKAVLGGSISISKSTIPRRITVDATYEFTIRVDNPPSGTMARYKVTLVFAGPGNYSYVSVWSEQCSPDNYVRIPVNVALPAAAIPTGQTSAIYNLEAVLEGEEA